MTKICVRLQHNVITDERVNSVFFFDGDDCIHQTTTDTLDDAIFAEKVANGLGWKSEQYSKPLVNPDYIATFITYTPA